MAAGALNFCRMLWSIYIIFTLLVLTCSFTSSLENPAMGIRAVLLHRDYLSPLHDSNYSKTPEDRLADSVQRSFARIRHLERKRHMITVESTVSHAREGVYIMNISLGTPPQRFLAVADTGSDVTWVQCQPCLDCFISLDSIFDPAKSTSYRSLPCSSSLCSEVHRQGYGSCSLNDECEYSAQYGDKSRTHGNFSTEILTVGTTDRGNMLASNTFAFGCGHNNTGGFLGIDGLVGLGRGLLSFPSQISHIVAAKFSHCLVSFSKAPTESSELLFGRLAEANSLSMQFTPLVNNEKRSSNYYVHLDGVAVDGVPLDISPSDLQIGSDGLGGTFLDSGTTVTHLVRPVYDALLSILNSTIAYPIGDGSRLKLELCFNTTGISAPTFPSISLQFRGADLVLPSENAFMLLGVGGRRTVCLAMVASKYFNVIGNIQMQNFQFLYDVENARVGFKSEECSSESTLNRARNAYK